MKYFIQNTTNKPTKIPKTVRFFEVKNISVNTIMNIKKRISVDFSLIYMLLFLSV